MITHSPIIFTDLRPAPAKARARRTDPQVSHDAAKRAELGKAERQRRAISDMLEQFGPQTCKELPHHIYHHTELTMNDVQVARRINEVEGIAPTGESRNGSRVWAVL